MATIGTQDLKLWSLELIGEIKETYPNEELLHKFLDGGLYTAVQMLRHMSHLRMTPAEIISAFQERKSDAIKADANRALCAQKYCERLEEETKQNLTRRHHKTWIQYDY